MRYNKIIGLKGNIYLLKNRIFRKRKKSDISVPNNKGREPLINIIVDNGHIEPQSYKNYIVTPKAEFDIKNNKAEYLCLLDDDTLCENALGFLINDCDVAYGDELMEAGAYYKSDWSPHTIREADYIGAYIIKANLYKNCDRYTLLKELSYKNIKVAHISKVVTKSQRNIDISHYNPPETDKKVSIIIPSKDNYDVLKRCIDSIKNKTDYKNYEIIVVDNGSKEPEKYIKLCDKYIYKKEDFNFSKMCNIGAKNSDGDFLLFLNDDTEVISPNWLNKMTAYGNIDNIGAVGAKLYYPNSKIIQHCGVINIQPGPVHCLNGKNDENSYYFSINKINRNVSAVTAACLLIDKNKFIEFDEDFKVAYNDVDMCLSLLEKGYYNIVLNDVNLYHYESLSRGDDRVNINKMKRLSAEKRRLYKKHSNFCCNDPFYNVNLTWHRADYSYENIVFSKETFVDIVETSCEIEYNFVRDGILYVGGYMDSDKIPYLSINNKVYRGKRELRYDLAAELGKKYATRGFSFAIPLMYNKKDFIIGTKK